MTNTLENIQQETMQLESQAEKIAHEAKLLKQIEEDYEAFFYQTASLFTELDEQFLQNDFNWYLNEQSEGLHQRKMYLFHVLADEQQQRHTQKAAIEYRQNDLFYQRKSLLASQEEPK